MAAISADNEGHRVFLTMEWQLPRVALVVMGVPGNDGMWVHPGLVTDGVYFREHERATIMIGSAGTCSLNAIAERRMMHGYDHRALVVDVLDLLQLSCEEGQLIVRDSRPGLDFLILGPGYCVEALALGFRACNCCCEALRHGGRFGGLA